MIGEFNNLIKLQRVYPLSQDLMQQTMLRWDLLDQIKQSFFPSAQSRLLQIAAPNARHTGEGWIEDFGV